MAQQIYVSYTVLQSTYELFDAPCCFGDKSVVVYEEGGAEIRECYCCGKHFAVIPDVIHSRQMYLGACVTFTEWTNEQGQKIPFQLWIDKHPLSS